MDTHILLIIHIDPGGGGILFCDRNLRLPNQGHRRSGAVPGPLDGNLGVHAAGQDKGRSGASVSLT